MTNYYYQPVRPSLLVQPVFYVRMLGLLLFIFGITIVVYVFTPLIIWQFTLAPELASEQITAPIPNRNVLTPSVIQSLIASSIQSLSGTDYTNASNWFPGYTMHKGTATVPSYFLSIPKLGITNAFVSTTDTNLAEHLVSLEGTPVPPNKGNTVIFGHSTLPQLFNPKNYHTIFADTYKLQVGDTFTTTVNNVIYTYKIFSITVVSPDDISVLAQTYDDSYVTLITCTPPGTIWERLVMKARLQKLGE